MSILGVAGTSMITRIAQSPGQFFYLGYNPRRQLTIYLRFSLEIWPDAVGLATNTVLVHAGCISSTPVSRYVSSHCVADLRILRSPFEGQSGHTIYYGLSDPTPKHLLSRNHNHTWNVSQTLWILAPWFASFSYLEFHNPTNTKRTLILRLA